MQEVINKVSKDFNLTKQLGKEVVESVVEGIISELQQKGRCRITKFGTFRVKEQIARIGRNPKTGESIQIPTKKFVKFVKSKELTEAL